MARFFIEEIDQKKVKLSEMDSKHAIKVLRLKKGAEIELLNGKGAIAKGIIYDENQKKTTVEIVKTVSFDPVSQICLAYSPTKSNDRNDWIIEKGTEIGVTHFCPIFTQNSERRKCNLERMEKVTIAAIKQCGNPWLPKIHQPQNFIDFISNLDFSGLKFIAHCRDGQKIKLKKVVDATKNQLVLIGPEGDFTKQEIDNAIENNFAPIDLGINTLRAETACISSLSLMKLA